MSHTAIIVNTGMSNCAILCDLCAVKVKVERKRWYSISGFLLCQTDI